MYKVVFTVHGKKDIKILPKEIQKRIIKKLTFFGLIKQCVEDLGLF